jgi:hypothetical protein
MNMVRPHDSRSLAAASGLLLVVVVTAAVIVGAYASLDPNHIRFGAPWPLASELAAAAAAVSLASRRAAKS